MEKIINLDLRKLLPFERHSRIFENWNALKEGEVLRIINDHEPKPLYYMFQAEYKGQFKWGYEKQGPKDWIFTIERISNKIDKKQEIKNLIKQLKTKKDVSGLKEKAKGMLKNISPTELGLIEQEIINEGVTRKEMKKLCDVHLEIMKDSLEKKELDLKPGHPIHTLTEEHKMILDFINKLNNVVSEIRNEKNIVNNIEILDHIAEHLIEADKHHQREEEVLFPELEKFGVIEPPEIMKEEHEELKAKKKELHEIINNKPNLKKLKAVAEFLIKELPDHIYKEDNILYPMAIQVIPEKNWKAIKEKCDKIGYCCFTPKS